MPSNDTHIGSASRSRRRDFSLAWSTLRRRLHRGDLLVDVQTGPAVPDAIEIQQVTADSRDVSQGTAFVAVRGTKADGHAFISDAVENGALLIICETVPENASERFPETLFAHVTDSRVAIAEAAAALFGDPGDALRLVGVTGTNGKTTVAYLVHHLLDTLGSTTGLLSTIEVRTGGVTAESALTTPGPVELHQTLRQMVDQGCTACSMEVSSHALDQERVHALEYDIGIFTNLTTDHLDYHGSPLAYRLAKKKLFDELPADATAVYNADDEAGPQMVSDTAASTLAYGFTDDADIQSTILESTISGLRLNIDGHEREFQLAGRFNAYNLAAAYGAGRGLGYDAPSVLDALAEAPPVPGRFEQLHFDGAPTVVVDYAHTPDALKNILGAVRETMPGEADLWCVFGCGGDRDPTKRGTMGQIAEERADHVIVTSDNPRTEAPDAIMDDIRRGVHRPQEMTWIVDREEAIQAASDRAGPTDVVVIAGKGHEPYQIIGTEKRPFDDRDVARTYFSR